MSRKNKLIKPNHFFSALNKYIKVKELIFISMTCKLKTIRFGCKTQTSVSQFRVYMIWRENNMLSKSNDKAALCRFWELNISISTF